jgi:hypothetical protein
MRDTYKAVEVQEPDRLRVVSIAPVTKDGVAQRRSSQASSREGDASEPMNL